MQFLRMLALAMLVPALTMPLRAGVIVSSPVTGSTVSNPVLYQATATTSTCSRGVGSMGIYVDNVLTSVTPGTVLNTSLVIAPGAHETVVEEWDRCGRASYSKLSIVVAAPQAATPVFSVPAGAYTSVQSIALLDATPGAILYYTTDGTVPTISSIPYSGAIQVTGTQAINAIAVASGYSTSQIASAAYDITLPTAPPTLSLPAGTYTSVQSVAMLAATPGSAIYYTTDGTPPTMSSQRYVGAIPVTTTQTISATAVASGYSSSPIVSAAYTITLPAAPPTFSVAGGAYTSVQTIILSDTTIGATIFYTLDGSTPTTSSLRYSGPIAVAASETINAIATAPDYSSSAISSAAYTVTLPAAPPRFSLPPGAYTSVQAAMISDPTPGAAIYYTMDGTPPTASSYQYVTAIPVATTETINAIAIAAGHSSSNVVSASYTVSLPAAAPNFSVPTGTYSSAQLLTLSSATPGAAIHYTVNGTQPTLSSQLYTGPIQVGASESIIAVAMAPGYSNSPVVAAFYTIKLASSGPFIPDDAISATWLQIDPRWKFNHDAGTPGTSVGAMAVVSDPSLSGNAAEFSNSYTNWGGEIYHLSFAVDTTASNFVYDAQVWIEQGSKIGNLEMDMNQVLANGDTVIFGFQCDGDNGTWDYSGNKGAISVSKIGWFHSTMPCNPAKWTPNAWHHVQISYSRDDVGNVTYNTVWLDGVAVNIGVSLPSAEALRWAPGHLLTNFQVDGVGASGSSVVYLDDLTISRW